MPDGILYYDDGILCWMGYRADGIVNVQPGGDRAYFDEPHEAAEAAKQRPNVPLRVLDDVLELVDLERERDPCHVVADLRCERNLSGGVQVLDGVGDVRTVLPAHGTRRFGGLAPRSARVAHRRSATVPLSTSGLVPSR